MGDYGFFIKSATFLILLNAVVFAFPGQVETLTGGKLNTSSLQGTNVSLERPQKFQELERVDLKNPLDSQYVELNSDGDVVSTGTFPGKVVYNISGFEEDSDGFREAWVEITDNSGLLSSSGLKYDNGLSNQTVGTDTLIVDIGSETLTFWFTENNAELQVIEDSQNYEHIPEKPFLEQFTEVTGLNGFTTTLGNLYQLYTTPASGNKILSYILTLYLLGFSVFVAKEVIPG
jgi:hypothetical protein